MYLFEDNLGFAGPVEMTIGLSVLAFCVTAVALVIGWLLPMGVDFINDEKNRDRNYLVDVLCRLILRHWDSNSNDYRDRHGNYKGELSSHVFSVWAIGTLLPAALIIGLKLYPLVLFSIAVVGLMFGARAIKRYQKLFSAHVKDLNAHKGSLK